MRRTVVRGTRFGHDERDEWYRLWGGNLFQRRERIVQFGVAVGTEKLTLARLRQDLIPGEISQRTHIQLKRLLTWVPMVELECCVITTVAASFAPSAKLLNESQFSGTTALALTFVALMVIVGIEVLAATPAEHRLTPTERARADHAMNHERRSSPWNHAVIGRWARQDSNLQPRDSLSPPFPMGVGLSLHPR
jgi:hypothetical protein